MDDTICTIMTIMLFIITMYILYECIDKYLVNVQINRIKKSILMNIHTILLLNIDDQLKCILITKYIKLLYDPDSLYVYSKLHHLKNDKQIYDRIYRDIKKEITILLIKGKYYG